MRGLCLPERKVFLVYSNPPVGSFAVEKEGKLSTWDHCREQFAAKFNESVESFYFSHKVDKSEDIVFFINKIEDIIFQNFQSFEYTKFARISAAPHVLYIEPSRFWIDCYFKKSLYTLFLRCAQNYSIAADNFDDALFGVAYKENVYIIETKMAVLRFLFGFTKYTGICPSISLSATVIKHGWKEEFHKLTQSEIKNRLVLPDGIKYNHNIVGSEFLWT